MSDFLDLQIRLDILDTLQTAVVAVSLEGKIVFWNDGAERITGYLRHEALGHQCSETFLLHCNQKNCELCGETCPRAAARHNARPAQSRSSIHHKSGERVSVHSWVVPVRNAHGTPVALAFSFEGTSAAADPDRREDGLDRCGLLDAPTGLANREMMQAHLRETLATFTELRVPFVVLRARLTGLAQLRATHGQAAVTAVFPAAARTLENALRPSDFVGRWGPDEFLGILNNCNAPSLTHLTERVHNMMQRAGIEFWGEELSIPVSINMAPAQPGDTMESLLERAAPAPSDTPTRSRAAAATDGGTRPKTD